MIFELFLTIAYIGSIYILYQVSLTGTTMPNLSLWQVVMMYASISLYGCDCPCCIVVTQPMLCEWDCVPFTGAKVQRFYEAAK